MFNIAKMEEKTILKTKILKFLKEFELINASMASKKFGIHYYTAENLLNKMVQEEKVVKKIIPLNKNIYTYYRLNNDEKFNDK